MKKLFSIFLVFLLTYGIGFSQELEPYVSRLVHVSIPTNNTDGSTIMDLKGINIYCSFDGETNFVKGTESPNFLAHIKAPVKNLSTFEQEVLLQHKILKWNGSFDNVNVWVRATARDDFNNESEFSPFITAVLSNVNLSNAPQIMHFILENGIITIWLSESDGTEVLEVGNDLINPNWIELGPLNIEHHIDEIPSSSTLQFFRVIRLFDIESKKDSE